ncbi:DUF4013 domain-containing protein [Xanthomonas translucens]|uniref:DUF4013 domain-containing protein n=1 Tax=Xanthomonas campestris pv. translucens TaxID=343 RepID=UPI0002A7B58C|nr:DUF4013 domain-containing protein [Xanthomonas translucens]ELQ13543.1 hypothetical protein A989_05813 [Xanthomonas translucens DAR61454]MBC3970817.1 DUF4013 domain-containing protein [Xanthomonas translucens pv. undulosa]MCT8280765.1 DUF4013 domain-containing protein [Xanthomonas translucens pv. undulosa]MCT8315628.1 DUF4013 domain-containing protein [Xanthomonas translucens pv. undulosa]QEN93111.1 hypothetical protein F0H33_06725 [Xanthomonas translucens pv. undulosa]
MEDRHRAGASRARRSTPAPFWARTRAIALYPLRGGALFALIALTLCRLLGMLPGIGWILGMVTALAIYKYAFEILRHTADGYMEAPERGFDIGDGVVLRLLALMIVLGAVVVAAALLAGPIAGMLTLLAVVLLQPGFLISLAIDGSLRRALNPAVSIGLALRIGWPYLAAFGLLFVIQASALTAANRLQQYLPPLASDLAVGVVTIWGLFAAFHLLGYLVYQYHEVLGYEPAADDDATHARHDPDQRVLDEAEQFVRDGHAVEALQLLRGEVRSRAVSLEVHELYQRLLRSGGRADDLREHSRQYINRLLQEKQERRALALLREALNADPDFAPLLPEQASLLAERAQLAGQFKLALDGLLAARRAWPKEPEFSVWSLGAALLLAERCGDDAQARTLLQDALAHCEDEAQRGKLQAALKALTIAPA